MIPINDMRFTVKVDGNGDTLVKGRLCFDAKYVISKYVVSASVEDLVKRCMREETWRVVYGEMWSPLRELEMHVFRAMPLQHSPRVEELLKELRTLLTMPEVKANPTNQLNPGTVKTVSEP